MNRKGKKTSASSACCLPPARVLIVLNKVNRFSTDTTPPLDHQHHFLTPSSIRSKHAQKTHHKLRFHRSMRRIHILLLILVIGSDAQFGEIASLATSLLGGALGNAGGLGALAGAGAGAAGAAGQAGGALAQIGQLYQLAQGALQLTGTGVGVLNQASEGNWFPAVLEQTAKNSQALMKVNQGGGAGGINLGALGPQPGKTGGGALGPEFGTSFPAPNIDDYDENAEIPGVTTDKKTPKAPDGLVGIEDEDEDYEVETTTTKKPTRPPTTTTTTTTTTTQEPEEEEETTTEPTTLPPRQIRIQLPDKNGKSLPEEELDYEDLIKKKTPEKLPTIDSEEIKKNVIATHGAKTQPIVPKLDKLVEVLQKSKLSQEEIDEIVSQVEGNKHIEKPAKYDFNAAVQNIPDKKNQIRQKITDASRIINTNLENQQGTIQKQVDELKVLPDINRPAIAPTPAPLPAPTPAPTPTLAPAQTQQPIHVQQSRSVAPPQPTVPQQTVNTYYQPQPQPQQQVYYTQAPYYGQQTQNYWGQQQFVPQQPQYGVQPQVQQVPQQRLIYSTPVPQPTQQVPQVPQQYYQQYVPRQQVPAQQRIIYQQGIAKPTTVAPKPQPQPLLQVTQNPNQVVHYYQDGRQIVQQIIPKRIAATGTLPVNGPFDAKKVVVTDPVEYARRQRALHQAYHNPLNRPVKPRPPPKLFESTVTATGNRQAHAIRTYQASTKNQIAQPATANRSSGRVAASKKRISGHVLPGPTIDHRSLLEKRTTAKPRYVRVP